MKSWSCKIGVGRTGLATGDGEHLRGARDPVLNIGPRLLALKLANMIGDMLPIENASIRGKFALRACFVNHRTSDDDVDAVVQEVLAAAAEVQ